MRPRRSVLSSGTLVTQARKSVRQEAPWLDKLSPRIRPLLDLPDLALLPPASAQKLDMVIVGGGVTGLSAAQAAAGSGARVLLLEAGSRLGLGASGRNAGIVSVGANLGLSDLPPDSPLVTLWPDTTEAASSLFRDAAQPDAILQARQTGALSLATEPEEVDWLTREAEARQAAGLRAEVWTAAQAAEQTGGRLNLRNVQAALWLPDEGRAYPLTVLAHLAEQARNAGAILVGNAEVAACQEVSYQEDGNAISRWEVRLRSGLTLSARGLIWATGPTITPSARLYALAFKADLSDDFPVFWDASHYTYYDYRPGNGWLIVSGGPYGPAGAADGDPAYHRKMAASARRWLPELARHRPRYTWAVDLAVSAEMLPASRTLGKRAPGYAIEGLGAQGVLPGIVLGRKAGEALACQLL
ncbi:MAG TPA: FAD-dependent oxidoreductase [Ktedonobacterales bacterium]|jgi:glycine/D-amino acid oxidase-like deaminating enzyme